MYNSGDGTGRSRQHLGDGTSITFSESGSVEGGNGEIPSSDRAIVKKTGDDPALTLMDRTFGAGWQQRFGDGFGQGLLGKPTEAQEPDDPFDGYGSITDFFGSQEGKCFLALLAKVLMLLAKSSGQNAAHEREVKMTELMDSLKENLEASRSLAEGARSALIAGVVSGAVGILGAGAGMGANAWAAKVKGQAGNVSKQMRELEEAGITDLLRADLPGGDGTGGSAQSAVDIIKAQKETMAGQIQALEAKAAKITSAGEGVGRVSMSAGGMGSSASTMVLTTAQADQAARNAVASQEAQTFHIEDDWQKQLTGLKDTILGVISEAIQAMARAQSSAFK
ncbi:hypothetical protein [Candidatus Ichthyocystis hellenicum]|uniref:hypothetical protein n=1 Tax=Candidatus Ichthyocystis hellenicum TaxID=1561003 RepID=UPI000B877FD9|nr:hypothetical protein [Candidatus Ichthyocystis hellenicum]